ncbi:pilus assembly protein [Sedimentimonas flavescens]|uniref:Pilus assembly protein n=1 Tax=Sedimentimonas flavescens TaxID=2851012 RepID=A0ABT2ZW98_9RHOB|nr:TadE/TadG family type IV pilus assembly protein [Sedimentimonas flavescens]MCV2878014.1 pilus assembly protein [Sedimentimonas flavescens]
MMGRREINTSWLAMVSRFRDEEDGASLVELAIVVALFLLILFGLIDYGRFAFHVVTTERALYMGARVATLRTPICSGVPAKNERAGGSTSEYGTSCGANLNGGNVCISYSVSCPLPANPTGAALEIWRPLAEVLPVDADPDNIRVTYAFDRNLGFLGGPVVPRVTVEVVPNAVGEALNFRFVTPLGALAALAMGVANDGSLAMSVPFRNASVSMPGEALGSVE